MSDLNSKSLPPLVDGFIYGHLTVTIDEVLWSRKYSGEVVVLLQWWGDSESVSLRPVDISRYSGSAKENISATYNIQTNFSLFQTYLKQCNKLKLLLVNNDDKEIVGHVEINNLHELVTGIQYQHYFPIITSSGSRIGDLRVNFDLSMNSIPEQTASKKMRRRSRKKNRVTHSSFRSADDEEKCKQIKKGCKTCSDHQPKSFIKPISKGNALNLELPKSPVNTQVPPNTELSDTSDSILLEVFEKGKKLRDAMVLSVLEDTEGGLDEELLLKLDQIEKESKSCYMMMKKHKNGDIISPCEEKLINDYLKGQTMKEEDEILVLNTLHAEKKLQNSEQKAPENCVEKSEASCCTSLKTSIQSAFSGKSQSVTDNSIIITKTESSSLDISSSVFKKVNCFRLTIDSLALTIAGWKKINQTIDNKNKSSDMVPPPGATYFVECHFVDDTPRSQAQPWKSVPLRFCSRRQIEQVIYFSQSSAHTLRSPHSLASTQSELAAMRCLVCWRHLNQRVPALLGHFSLAGVLAKPSLETSLSLPVTSDTGTIVAHVRVRFELGKDKIYFGHALLEDTNSGNQECEVAVKLKEDDCVLRIKDIPLNTVEMYSRSNSHKVDNSHIKNDIINTNTKTLSQKMCKDSLQDYINIPLCTNCNQNFVLTNLQKSAPESTICVSCTNLLSQNQVHLIESNFKISIPKNFATKEQRHHEFLLGIDTIIGFPLFAGIQDGLSCYVDYKFPEITSGLKVEMARTDTTSRVVGCEPQPSFTSVHRHVLLLPVVLPLSPLLASCSPGITLRLWLRYYKPTPRDHMVAMALLPMNDLCLMELEFDKNQQKSSVIRVLELPLALVPSSVTSSYQQYHNLGVLRVSVTYSNHISHASSNKEYHPITPEGLKTDLIKNDSFKEEIDANKRRPMSKECKKAAFGRNIHTLQSSKYSEPDLQTQFMERAELKSSKTVCDRGDNISKDTEVLEEELKLDKNKFWIGPFGKANYDKDKQSNTEEIKSNNSQYVDDKTQNIGFAESTYTKNINPVDILNNIPENIAEQSVVIQESSLPVMKEDFDVLAESLEQRFNQLQSELIKERQKGLTEIDNIVKDTRKSNNLIDNNTNDDLLSFQSFSSTSSMESLPFILGPPTGFKDSKDPVISTKVETKCSDSQSEQSTTGTISGFLKEEKNFMNLSLNDSFRRRGDKPEIVKPKTFKAKIKVDRAVNLKAVKAPCNGKKGKVPPSTWVSFGTGNCCDRNCGTGDLVCSGQRFTTPVIRRNYNPIWNLSWDIDLPVDYLQQVNKRLIFWVFEENLNTAFGFASANLSILTSGLPCLSSWLSINDLSGACKGQIKIVITPLEDVSQYQECSVFDTEEDECEEPKENKQKSNSSPQSDKREPVSFVASQTQVFVNETDTVNHFDKEVEVLKHPDNTDDMLMGDDQFSADDIISDYKSTLENNFRNEMAGLENLIKFLRVGPMSNELSFLRATENKENLSSNGTTQHAVTETRAAPSTEYLSNISTSLNNQLLHQRDKNVIDASTETTDRVDIIPSSTDQDNTEDILSKLLQQISMFQLPTVKITDSTSQTVTPETKEKCTETTIDNQSKSIVNKTVHMKDISTETEDICHNRLSSSNSFNEASQPPHVCGELGSMLLQHFLSCKPAAVKVMDSACQTMNQDKLSTTDSSEVFARSQPLGMSTEILSNGNKFPPSMVLPEFVSDWHPSEEQTNSERLIEIDNNIKDLEQFLKENMMNVDRTDTLCSDSKGVSSSGSLNSIIDSIQGSINKTRRSSSDVESLESCSQLVVISRETPDGGNPPSVPDTQGLNNVDKMETTLKRQGTFVIVKSKDTSENAVTEKKLEVEDLA